MTDRLKELQSEYAAFVRERDWEQYHSPQNLAMALSIEANELLECFLWHDNVPAPEITSNHELRTAIEAELADVIIYALGMAEQLDIDLLDAVEAKLEQNKDRFDAETVAEINAELDQWQRD